MLLPLLLGAGAGFALYEYGNSRTKARQSEEYASQTPGYLDPVQAAWAKAQNRQQGSYAGPSPRVLTEAASAGYSAAMRVLQGSGRAPETTAQNVNRAMSEAAKAAQAAAIIDQVNQQMQEATAKAQAFQEKGSENEGGGYMDALQGKGQ